MDMQGGYRGGEFIFICFSLIRFHKTYIHSVWLTPEIHLKANISTLTTSLPLIPFIVMTVLVQIVLMMSR